MRSAASFTLSCLLRAARHSIVAAVLCAPGLVMAQPEKLTLEQAIQTALTHRAELNAADSTARATQALRRQAGALPNPRLFFQSENLRPNMDFASTVDTYAYISQPIEVSGRRGARIGVAESAVAHAQLSVEQQKRDIEFAVAQVYWETLRLAYLRLMAEETQGFYHELLEYHQHRFEEGKLAAVDLMRIQLEDARAQTRLEASRLAEAQARNRLAEEMGLPAAGDWALTGNFETVNPPSPESLTGDAFLERIEVRLARQRMDAARAAVTLQKTQGRPDLDVLFGYKRTSGNDTMLAGVQMPLPLLDRNRGGVQAAQLELNSTRETLSGIELRSRAELDLARTAYATWKRQVVELYGPMVAQSKEIVDISRAAYREGGTDLLRLLDAERIRVDTQTAWAEALGNYHQSVLALDYAAGMEPR